MLKRIVTALLYATMNLAWPTDADVIEVIADEDDSGGKIEQVEYVAAASVRFGADDVATIELIEPAARSNVADARLQLLDRALNWARDNGALKVRVATNLTDTPQLRAFIESHGFQFSRIAPAGAGHFAEFYTDLYWTAGAGWPGKLSRT